MKLPRWCSNTRCVCAPATLASEVSDDRTNERRRLGILDSDVHQEVVRARDVEGLDHLGQLRDPAGEAHDVLGVVSAQPQGDDGLDGPADLHRVDVGGEAADHPALDEVPHPHEGGRGGDADAVRQGAVGDPPVGHEGADERPIDGVEGLNDLRGDHGQATRFRQVNADSRKVPMIIRP